MSRTIFIWAAFILLGSQALYHNIEKKILETFNEFYPMENKNLIEGDILADDDETLLYNAVPTDSKRWHKGIVPYVVDPSLKSLEPLIKEAMSNIETRTKCIRFVPRGNERDHILISKGTGCYSYVGRQGGQQIVSLGKGCHHLGTIVHELTHALGFHHEHNRPDRDDHIKIYMENIDPTYGPHFEKKKAGDIRSFNSFSYDSIMLYGSKSFSKTKGKPSMTKLNGEALTEVYQKKGLSNSDVERFNKLYRC